MEREELRIGNYIKDKLTGIILVVDELGVVGFDKHIHVHTKNNEKLPHIAKVEPIPLSEDLLLKCGYKFYNGKTEGDLCMDFGGKLDIDFINRKIQVKSHYEEYTMYRPIFGIKYLHQLQNLYYSLTGKELEINL